MTGQRAAVVVVHSHPVMRTALESIVRSAPDMTLAASFESPALLNATVFRTEPTMLIIGAADALSLERDLLSSWSDATDIRLIAVDETLTNTMIVALSRLSVFDALVTWDEPPESVLVAVRRLLRGEAPLTDIVSKGRTISRLLAVARTDDDADADAVLSPLTANGRAALEQLLATGDRDRAARTLGITKQQLYYREITAYRHLGVRNPFLAQAYALSRRFVHPYDAHAVTADAPSTPPDEAASRLVDDAADDGDARGGS